MKRWNCKAARNLRGRDSRKILRVSRWALLISFSVLYTYPWEIKALWLFLIIINTPGLCLFWREKKKKVESWFSCGKPLFYPFYPFLHFLSTQQSHFNHQNGTKDILGKITNVFFFIHLSLPFHVIPWPYLVGFGIYLKMKKWKPCLKEI